MALFSRVFVKNLGPFLCQEKWVFCGNRYKRHFQFSRVVSFEIPANNSVISGKFTLLGRQTRFTCEF